MEEPTYYVIEKCYDYEGCEVLGVFADSAAAEAWLEEYYTLHGPTSDSEYLGVTEYSAPPEHPVGPATYYASHYKDEPTSLMSAGISRTHRLDTNHDGEGTYNPKHTIYHVNASTYAEAKEKIEALVKKHAGE